ncbi:MAG: hypothetical protein WC796_05360 [Candidatus Pacearchaeota archaeon]|jgi:hypothetical protein
MANLNKKKAFFRPTKAKFILPIILVVLTILLFLATKDLNSKVGDYSCKILEIKDTIRGYETQGNIISLNDAKFRSDEMTNELLRDLENNKLQFAVVNIYNQYVNQFNPIYPADCSFSGLRPLCGSYSSQEDYDCAKRLFADSDVKILGIFKTEMPEYKKPSSIILILSLIYLFIISYLISCVIAFVYRSLKPKT